MFFFCQQPRNMTFIHAAGIWWLFFGELQPTLILNWSLLLFFILFPSFSAQIPLSLSFTPTRRWISLNFTKRRSRFDIDTVRQGCHVCFETVLALQTLGHSYTFTHSHTLFHTLTHRQTQTMEGRVPKSELSATSKLTACLGRQGVFLLQWLDGLMIK